jgi:pyruvate kinase
MTRRARIMPTLGPSSWDEANIEALVRAGANAFRLNFSHGDATRHRQTYANIRKVADKLGRHIPILQDLQGPKIRVGAMAEAVTLETGKPFLLDNDPTPGDVNRVELPHPEILASLRVGDIVALNDGVIRVEIMEVANGKAAGVVRASGLLSSRKGVNVPGRELPMTALTPKDLADLQVGLDMGVDWVALSFVQTAADIKAARDLIGDKAMLMAKIETQAAVANLVEILAAADGIMIARGDLGVELPPEEVPPLQRRMLAMGRAVGKPVVVATQMLESMIQNPTPTRAEASDVATAAYEQADCLMLSAESASGKYPIEAVSVMSRIIARSESTRPERQQLSCEPGLLRASDALSHAATQLAEEVGAACIVAFSEMGGTTIRVARWRPSLPILCLTPHAATARRVSLVWGITPHIAPGVSNTDEMVAAAIAAARTSGLANAGQSIVIVAGIPFGQKGTTNLIRVATV